MAASSYGTAVTAPRTGNMVRTFGSGVKGKPTIGLIYPRRGNASN